MTGTLHVTASAGSITSGNGGGNNIDASAFAGSATAGIGTVGDPIESTVTNFEATGGTGGTFLTNTGALTIGGADGVIDGISVTGNDIIVLAASPLVISAPVVDSGGGDIILTATNDGGLDDHLTISANVTATGGNGAIDLNAGTDLFIDTNASVSTVGTGAITGDAERAIEISSNAAMAIQSANGAITLNANTPGPQVAGEFNGIELSSATIQTDNGAISLTGRGGAGAMGNADGVFVDSSTIRSTGSGTITINGIATDGNTSDGVDLDNDATGTPSLISSNTGAILITGTTGAEDGVEIGGGSDVTSTGSATITINGTADNVDANDGVEVSEAGTLITSVNGSISITGSTIGDDPTDQGVRIENGAAVTSTGTATITLDGTSSDIDGGDGLQIIDAGSQVTSLNGDVSLTGISSGNDGVDIGTQAEVISTGSATITIDGTVNNIGGSDGVELADAGTNITSATGNISITGSTIGNEASDDGVDIDEGALVASTGSALITIDGTSSDAAGGEGVSIATAGTQVTSLDGDIAIDGTSGSQAGILLTDTASLDATGTANITLQGTGGGAESGVQVDSSINSATGVVTVRSEDGSSSTDDISFGVAGAVTSTSGTVTIDADNAGTTADVFMADGAVINAGSGLIDIDANVDVTLGGLQTTSDVQITAVAGGVIDGGDIDTDITANSGTVVIDAVTGVGDANPIDTTIATLDLDNTTSGNVGIVETDAIVLVGVTSGGGNLDVVSVGDMDVVSAISASGVVTLTNGGLLTTSAVVTADGGFGQDGIGGVHLGANVTAGGSGISFDSGVTLIANVVLDTSVGGDITFAGIVDGARTLSLNAGSGTTEFQGDVAVGDGTADAITIVDGDVNFGFSGVITVDLDGRFTITASDQTVQTPVGAGGRSTINYVGAGNSSVVLIDASNVTIRSLEITGGNGVGGHGIHIHDSDNVIVDNDINDNDEHGVRIDAGTGNVISQNTIYDNGQLGIDLAGGTVELANGVTLNDKDFGTVANSDNDAGPNNLQNTPEVLYAFIVRDGGGLVDELRISYHVPSATAHSAYGAGITTEFFLADFLNDGTELSAGTGRDGREGATFVGSAVYTDDANNEAMSSLNKSFARGDLSATVLGVLDSAPVADFSTPVRIVATATDSDGNTSEFSRAAVVNPEPGIEGADDAVHWGNLGTINDAPQLPDVDLLSQAGFFFTPGPDSPDALEMPAFEFEWTIAGNDVPATVLPSFMDNELGIYRVDNRDGDVDSVAPSFGGASVYAQTALVSPVFPVTSGLVSVLRDSGPYTPTSPFPLVDTGSSTQVVGSQDRIGFYLVYNSTSCNLLDTGGGGCPDTGAAMAPNPNNNAVSSHTDDTSTAYFSFVDANPDGEYHIRTQLWKADDDTASDNGDFTGEIKVFWEDMFGLGDFATGIRDGEDAIITFHDPFVAPLVVNPLFDNTVTAAFDAQNGVLTVESDNDDAIAIQVSDGVVQVMDDGAVIGGIGELDPMLVQSLVVTGGPGDNRIDLSAVRPGDFPALASVHIDAGDGNDVVIGSAFADVIEGGLGDDKLNGAGGNDVVSGGDGQDTLVGGRGRDTLRSGTGNDVLKGQGGPDRLEGQDGDDLLVGDLGHDRLYGGRGHDVMRGGAGHDTLNGGGGNDTQSGEAGNDRLFGGAGRDWLRGDSGSDVIKGQGGIDTLDGGDGHDRMFGGSGRDRMHGEDGDDTLDGGSGDDTLDGGRGNDGLAGARGRDILNGRHGNDTLVGGADDDTLLAGAGRDLAMGSDGNDFINGQGGSGDTISGGEGDDTTRNADGLDRIDEAFQFFADWIPAV